MIRQGGVPRAALPLFSGFSKARRPLPRTLRPIEALRPLDFAHFTTLPEILTCIT
jgi:hypothetical protein